MIEFLNMNRIEIVQGDITKLHVDAIVNAANNSLLGGGGVDGAIHRAAGPELLIECISLKGCATGAAKITKGYKLPAKYIIHTVGPIWHGGLQGEDELLINCYLNSIKLASEYHLKSIAFPAISTGVYRFPIERATEIALITTVNFLKNNKDIEKVIFACFSTRDLQVYQKNLSKILNQNN